MRLNSIKMLGAFSISTILRHFDRVILMLIFNFEPWAVLKGYERKYVLIIRNYVNNINNIKHLSILELGSGLGDIIRYINCNQKLASDRHNGLLNANKLLSKFKNIGNLKHRKIDFTKDQIDERFDVIIMTNFCHGISHKNFNKNFIRLFRRNLNPNGIIIIDKNNFDKYDHNYKQILKDFQFKIKFVGEHEGKKILEIRKLI